MLFQDARHTGQCENIVRHDRTAGDGDIDGLLSVELVYQPGHLWERSVDDWSEGEKAAGSAQPSPLERIPGHKFHVLAEWCNGPYLRRRPALWTSIPKANHYSLA